MAKKDQNKSNPTSSLLGDIPAEVMAKLQAAYQASGSSSTQGCPEPETVIGYALEELIPEKRAQVYGHLSECKDCLDLVLDLRFAWAEAQEAIHKVRESTPIRVQAQVQAWLAGIRDGVNGLLARLAPLPRLIPVAAAAVVLLVVGVGVFQHLTAPTSGRPSLTLTSLKPDTAYDYRVRGIDKAESVSPGAIVKTRAEQRLAFLPLLLEN